jgi:hypothetical protein
MEICFLIFYRYSNNVYPSTRFPINPNTSFIWVRLLMKRVIFIPFSVSKWIAIDPRSFAIKPSATQEIIVTSVLLCYEF